MVNVPWVGVVNIPSWFPPAVVGSVVTLFGYWGLHSFNRWRKRVNTERNAKIEWYQDMAALCKEIQTTYDVMETVETIRDDPIPSNFNIKIEDAVREAWDDVGKDTLGPEEVSATSKKIRADLAGELTRPMIDKIHEYVADHFVDLRRHYSARPRDVTEEDFEDIDRLLAGLFGIAAMTEITQGADLTGKPVDEYSNNIIEVCETEVDCIKRKRWSSRLSPKRWAERMFQI